MSKDEKNMKKYCKKVSGRGSGRAFEKQMALGSVLRGNKVYVFDC
ncbi:hypothetical protein [Dysosmobacter acutus]|nr:hypothetical protein [Dysosmobacter acutus]